MKKILSLFLILCIIISILMTIPITVSAATSGTCGDNLTWSLDNEGTLTINGSGDMYDFSMNSVAPWHESYLNITSVIINDGITNVGDYAFYPCSQLINVVIPKSVTKIGASAFSSCVKLTSVTIPDGVTDIGVGAFSSCANLKTIIIPNSVTHIGDSAFRRCANLETVTISDSLTSIGEATFSFCYDLKNVNIPYGVTNIGAYAFHNCTRLSNISIPNTVTTIGKYAFADCDSLVNIALPSELTIINEYMFYMCDVLSNINIPSGVTIIGKSAFAQCYNLTDITIPSSVKSIGGSAFRLCSSLTNVNTESISTWLNIDFAGFESNPLRYASHFYLNGELQTNINIPSNVSKIKAYAFSYYGHLSNITIPETVTSIGEGAFYKCSNLTKVEIPQSVINIADSAFSYCSGLTNLTIPSSITNIGKNTFSNCVGLTRVAIPKEITSIKIYAFDNCNSLTDVYYSGTEEDWGNIAIQLNNNYLTNATIHYNCTMPEMMDYFMPSTRNGTFNFASGKKRTAEFNYDDNYFAQNSYIYNHDLAKFSMRLALSAFAKKTGSGSDKDYTKQYENAMNLLENCKFENIQWNADYEEQPQANGIGLIAGNKRIKYDSGNYTLIALAIRGGGYEAEWGGNLTVGNDEHHQGFEIARNYAIQFIQDYIASNEITGKVKLLVTGFSRAAATANLTAAYFDEYPERLSDNVSVNTGDIFAYCFETPAGVLYPDNDSGLYNNIYSIVNQHDPVPMVAMREWGYDRYGRTLYLPAAQTHSKYFELREKMIPLYDEYIGNNKENISEDDKKPYKIDNFSKYTYSSAITYKYALENAQGVYLEQIVDKLAKSIGSPSNYKEGYQEAFAYLGENLIGGNNSEEFINSLLYEFSWRYGTKKITGFVGSLVPYKHIIRESLNAAFNDVGIAMDSNNILIGLIISLGVDDFITILKNIGNFGQAHSPELCMAWLDTISGEEDFTDARLRTLYVNCPVDVEVYDSNDNLVAAIYDNEVQAFPNSTIITYIDDNGQKVMYLPQDTDYRVEILATDEGEVTYSVQEKNVATGETKIVNYNNMTVSKDDTLTGTVENLATTENATYLLESKSVEVSEAEIIEKAESIEISTDVEGNGIVNNGGIYYKGEYAQVNAEPFENEEFLGWYNGTELVSEEASYRFQVTETVTLTAKFTENTCAIHLAESDEKIIDIVRIIKGNNVVLEKEPEKEGYTFDGLYTDSTFETAITTEDMFWEDTTLYVKWEKNINITNASYTNNAVEVNATMVNNLVQKSGVVFIALYYDNRLVGLKQITINKDICYTFENIEEKENNYTVKIMCWESMSNMRPLNVCEVATVQK